MYVGEDRVLTTSQEYDKMKGFVVEEGKVSIPLNVSVHGDVTIAIFHARSTFGGKVQGKVGWRSNTMSVFLCFLRYFT